MYFSEYMTQSSVAQFMYRVYAWMTVALAISGLTAYFVGTNTALVTKIMTNPWIFIGLFIIQLVLVIALSSAIMRLSYGTAIMLFLGYSVATGMTLSCIFLVYTMASIYQAFFITAGTFGLMATYGYYTQSDLTKMRDFLYMALFGLMLAMLVNFFWANTRFDFIISIIGVLLFTGLTAVDTQKIKEIGQQLLSDRQTLQKISIIGALTLYLDFLNLFLFILRLMGRQRE
jgi:FtsH-binding integral membrane protein